MYQSSTFLGRTNCCQTPCHSQQTEEMWRFVLETKQNTIPKTVFGVCVFGLKTKAQYSSLNY